MQQKMFDPKTIGYSKKCQLTLDWLRMVGRFSLTRSRSITAYELSKMSEVSRQHTQRCLEKLLADGLVDFEPVVRKGKPAREWFAK